MDDLIVEGVTKRYGHGPAVFSDLSHTFRAGTATALLGPNGSGKTTLLRLLSTTSFPTTGAIHFGKIDIHDAPYEYLKRTGIVHDESALPRFLNAVELLEYALRTRNDWDAGGPGRIDEMLNRLDLDERRDQPIGTYSSGMFKKTQIALALIAHPSVLLMDEPFRGLDESSLNTALQLFLERKTEGSILVIASHRQDLVDALCDGYLDMSDGGSRRADTIHRIPNDAP